jgi:hypothetical protein
LAFLAKQRDHDIHLSTSKNGWLTLGGGGLARRKSSVALVKGVAGLLVVYFRWNTLLQEPGASEIPMLPGETQRLVSHPSISH